MFSKDLIQVVSAVWQQIGSDVEQCAAECGEAVSHSEAVESCMDASRPETFCGEKGKAASAEFSQHIAKVGYTRALKDLCKAVPALC